MSRSLDAHATLRPASSEARGRIVATTVDHFRTFGFVVVRNAFDPSPLREEVDRTIAEGAMGANDTPAARTQYVPMMTARTPRSLSLLDRFETLAATLLGGSVFPLRAKGMRCFGGTSWHVDSADDVVSVGFVAYLEPLSAENGALRVLPGSHRHELGDAVRRYLTGQGAGLTIDALPGVAIATQPGDVIAFDEHLLQASAGGGTRRQWRVDYLREPRSADEERCLRAHVARVFPPDWDGCYDVDLFPSYGSDWLGSSRACVQRLRDLGVYRLAEAQENFMRARRPPSQPKTIPCASGRSFE